MGLFLRRGKNDFFFQHGDSNATDHPNVTQLLC